ncbi:MAG TPA: hypothetical protein VFI25_00500 [Planctomycetota bacterium]|nr:hypothetical protein [Planctomycetota bacterium]
MVDRIDFYGEKKWCRKCGKNVRYLMSVQHSYCVHCGSVVTLFSKEAWRRFNAQLEAAKEARRGNSR